MSTVNGGPRFDRDAQTFITAVGITDATQKSAINTLVLDLKGYSIWTKMKALYPFVGGTATTHKWNLKDPQDTNASFRLTFSGGVTHDSNGIQGNGINTYGDTFFIPNSHLSSSSQHLSIYSRTNVGEAKRDIGTYTSGTNSLICTLKWSDGNLYFNNGASYATVSNSDSKGFYISNKIASGTVIAYKNGSNVASTTSSDTLSTYSVAIMALNTAGSFTEYTTRQYSFASIGDGLSSIESSNFYTAIQAFQTTLSRQV